MAAVGSLAGIALSWTPSTAPLLAGYNVYRSTSSGGTYVQINTTLLTTASYIDTTIAAGAKLYYKVAAADTWGGTSAQTASVNATRTKNTTGVNPLNPPALTPTPAGNNAGITLSLNSCQYRVRPRRLQHLSRQFLHRRLLPAQLITAHRDDTYVLDNIRLPRFRILLSCQGRR